MFFICETILVAAKWQSEVPTPGIERDMSVTFGLLTIEISKILIYRKYKDYARGNSVNNFILKNKHEFFVFFSDLVTGIVVFLTCFTICGCCYTLLRYQIFVARLEFILCSLLVMLSCTEVSFGVLQILPCFKKVTYY